MTEMVCDEWSDNEEIAQTLAEQEPLLHRTDDLRYQVSKLRWELAVKDVEIRQLQEALAWAEHKSNAETV